MNGIYISGLGAVSPAGWGVSALREVLNRGEPLPTQTLDRPGGGKPLQARLVPNPVTRPEFLSRPRLRRTSPITHYAAATALEAMMCLRANKEARWQIGVIVCLQSGCVQYSHRFFLKCFRTLLWRARCFSRRPFLQHPPVM